MQQHDYPQSYPSADGSQQHQQQMQHQQHPQHMMQQPPALQGGLQQSSASPRQPAKQDWRDGQPPAKYNAFQTKACAMTACMALGLLLALIGMSSRSWSVAEPFYVNVTTGNRTTRTLVAFDMHGRERFRVFDEDDGGGVVPTTPNKTNGGTGGSGGSGGGGTTPTPTPVRPVTTKRYPGTFGLVKVDVYPSDLVWIKDIDDVPSRVMQAANCGIAFCIIGFLIGLCAVRSSAYASLEKEDPCCSYDKGFLYWFIAIGFGVASFCFLLAVVLYAGLFPDYVFGVAFHLDYSFALVVVAGLVCGAAAFGIFNVFSLVLPKWIQDSVCW